MIQYRYLIVGGGMAADAAVRGIRSVDEKGSIGVISNDLHPPYKRPPLSKSLWKGESAETIWLPNSRQHVTLHLSRTAVSIDRNAHEVVDDRGERYRFERLLLATGGRVRTLPFDVEGILYYRTYADYTMLRHRLVEGGSSVVIGGGFIGSEIAAALAMNGQHVTMIFPDSGVCGRIFPPRLSGFLNEYYTSKGVAVRPQQRVTGITRKGSTYVVATSAGDEIRADVVVAGIGVEPDVTLARTASIAVSDGILVNDILQTSLPDVYAAGDAAEFFSPSLGMRIHVEHEDNALAMGECAGRNMAGESEPYLHLPFFYSDLFDLGYEAVGELNSRYEIVEDWKEEFREGVIYYLDNQHIRGVLLWNTWGQVDNARAMIREKEPATPLSLKGLLPV